MDHLSLLHDPREELGHVVPDVEVAEAFGHPPPALHIGEHAVNFGDAARLRGPRLAVQDRPGPWADDAIGQVALVLLIGLDRGIQRLVEDVRVTARAGHLQPAPQQGDLRVRQAELEIGTIRQGDVGRIVGIGLRLAGRTRLEQRLPQTLELDVLRMQAAQVGVG